MKFTIEQWVEIDNILNNPDTEKSLIELKQYFATFVGQMESDYTIVAYNIWLKYKNKYR